MTSTQGATASRRIERELRALVDRAIPGAKIYFPRRAHRRARYSWNGRHLRPTGLTLESQCHEVAHLLVSSSARRKHNEFGLGADPYRSSDAPRIADQETADREEEDACTMQLVLARVLGLSEYAIEVEVYTGALTPERLCALRRRCGQALPEEWWRRAAVGGQGRF
jgi:hypothetical protein